MFVSRSAILGGSLKYILTYLLSMFFSRETGSHFTVTLRSWILMNNSCSCISGSSYAAKYVNKQDFVSYCSYVETGWSYAFLPNPRFIFLKTKCIHFYKQLWNFFPNFLKCRLMVNIIKSKYSFIKFSIDTDAIELHRVTKTIAKVTINQKTVCETKQINGI